MVTASLVVTILLSFILLILGLIAYLRDQNALLNRRFAGFAFAVAIWLVLNYLAADITLSHDALLLTNRLVLGAGGLAICFMLSFLRTLAGWHTKHLGWPVWLYVFNVISWVFAAITPYVVKDVTVRNGEEVNIFGPLAVAYFLPLFITFLVAMATLIVGHYKLKGIVKAQFDTIARSIIIVIPIVLAGNAILPILDNYRLVNVTPLFISLIVIAMFDTIVRHRLFNIRLVIVRSLGYVFSLGLISVCYGVITQAFTDSIVGKNIFLKDAVNVVLILVVVVTFPPLKRAFDRFTNRLFYRDAYDPQSLFDRLNKVLVTTYELDALVHAVTQLLSEELKSTYAAIGLKEIIGRPQRIQGTEKMEFSFKDTMAVRRLTVKYHQSVLVTDLLDDKKDLELKKLLLRNNVMLLVRLAPNVQRTEEGLGYLMFGPKKSGNAYTSQDVRVLETVANELIIAIQNALHFEEIQNFNKTLQEKVDQATRELRRTNEKLKALDETKDDFISMASHQLRTPLTSVKGYLSLVLDGDAGPIKPTQRELLLQAFTSSQRMVYLISDLLNVSRLKTGKFIIDAHPIDLSEIIVDELAQLKETAATRSLELTYDKPAHFPTLMFDETRTRQVIMNFVDNAIYYTPAGGHIRVELVDRPKTIELRVIDDGIGVPVHEQHHLFTKFYRAGNARKARPDGTGLGLFMAKKVIVAQGGSIIFESKEGRGSTFGFSFTKARLLPPPTPTIGQD